MSSPEPDDLRALGQKITEARGADRTSTSEPLPGAIAVAFRFGTELVVAPAVCGGLGWLLDRWLHTSSPVFLVILFILGAAAGIRNVMRAAAELNAEAAKHPAPPVKDDEDEE
jgi:ATP synthase protein I